MIGNDIVDLQEAALQSNWRRQGWLQKVCTPEEIKRIKDSNHPDQLVWELWSRKEAAYKAHQRRFPHYAKLNPIQFECKENMVLHGGYSYVVNSSQTSDYVYSWVDSGADHLVSKVTLSPEEVKQEIIPFFAKKYAINEALIQMHKDRYRIPYVTADGERTNDVFSITHHGRFAAYLIYNS